MIRVYDKNPKENHFKFIQIIKENVRNKNALMLSKLFYFYLLHNQKIKFLKPIELSFLD